MILITAALKQELRTAQSMCLPVVSRRSRSFTGPMGERNGREFAFLRTGVGASRASASLRKALAFCRPELILCIGYAGALDPILAVGDLIAVTTATMLLLPSRAGARLEEADRSAILQLDQIRPLPTPPAGHRLVTAGVLTSPCVIGDPDQKRALFEAFSAAVIDMETAALAHVAQEFGVRIASLRSISDTASDDFLAPFSYDPSAGLIRRAVRIAGAGRWFGRVVEWRERAAIAAGTLRSALESWTDSFPA